MLEVDERADDEQRNENPVGDRDLPGKLEPDAQEKQRSQELDCEVAKGDPAAAIRATAAQEKPAEQWDVLIPRELFFAGRAKGTARLVHRKIERHPVNADVQERADHRAENEREGRKEKVVTGQRVIHALGQRSFA